MNDLTETMKEAVRIFLATCQAEKIGAKIHLQYNDCELTLCSRMWEEEQEEQEKQEEEEEYE